MNLGVNNGQQNMFSSLKALMINLGMPKNLIWYCPQGGHSAGAGRQGLHKKFCQPMIGERIINAMNIIILHILGLKKLFQFII